MINGGKVNPEDTPQGNYFYEKNQLNLEETIRRRDDNYYLEEEMKIRQYNVLLLNFTLHGNTLLVNQNW